MTDDIHPGAARLVSYALANGRPPRKKVSKPLGADNFGSNAHWIHLCEISTIISADLPDSDSPEVTDQLGEAFMVGVQTASQYKETQNIYFAFDALLESRAHKVPPPQWALDAICSHFERHLKDPDPELFASQMGISARGSGQKSQYKQWLRHKMKENYLGAIMTLGEMFTITVTDAARVVKIVFDLDISERTIVNEFTKVIPSKDFHNAPPWESGVWSDEDIDDFVKECPPAARRILGKYKRIR